jgi:uncharacterized membrane protein YhaH (DUF805 family)
MYWYMKVMENYATFRGRARRKEYWMFFLVNFLFSFGIGFILGFIGAVTKNPSLVALMNLYSLATLLPSFAVAARRLHDTDHSAWWMLCPVYNLVLFCLAGTEGDNRFGPDPKKARGNPIKNETEGKKEQLLAS